MKIIPKQQNLSMNCRELSKRIKKDPKWIEELKKIVRDAISQGSKFKGQLILPPIKKRYKRGWD